MIHKPLEWKPHWNIANKLEAKGVDRSYFLIEPITKTPKCPTCHPTTREGPYERAVINHKVHRSDRPETAIENPEQYDTLYLLSWEWATRRTTHMEKELFISIPAAQSFAQEQAESIGRALKNKADDILADYNNFYRREE